MNDYDRDNIQWLISASEKEIRQFMQETDEDTLMYMLDLVLLALAEVDIEEMDNLEYEIDEYKDIASKEIKRIMDM